MLTNNTLVINYASIEQQKYIGKYKFMNLAYCKRFYFRATNFSRFAAQKHIRGLLNSRWADAHLSFLYCTITRAQS